ncbi:hypothetical protein A2U01_0056057, partial [Trifolium medium]|nr:hypothetical protein [Trifolium medium]
REIICITTETVGVELLYPRKIANSNHAVEVHPSVSLNNLSHLWVSSDAREVDAPLLNNTLATDGPIMLFFFIVKEADVVFG